MQNRLGMALTLESHLAELRKDISESSLPLLPARGEKAAKRIGALEGDCYVCSRIEYNFSRMTETVVLLWDTDEDFPISCARSPISVCHTTAAFWRRRTAVWPRKSRPILPRSSQAWCFPILTSCKTT